MQNIAIQVHLDKPRTLHFTMDSAELAETKFGINLMQIDHKKMGFTTMKQIIFAALLDDDPNLKYEKVGRIIDAYEPGPIDLIEKAAEAMKSFLRTTGRKSTQ